MLIDRELAAQWGQETVRIIETGWYTAENGETVEIRELVRHAVTRTQSYPPGTELKVPPLAQHPTRISVVNETTLVTARKMVEAGRRPVALNFASAKNPGGGFLTGARAQEESLVRSSGLYACLVSNEMYAYHRVHPDAMYTHYAIYSPDVPVFREDGGALLAQPYLCSFITCPAVNAKVVLQRDPGHRGEIRKVMAARTHKVLAVAAAHGHESLILGAWGCGAFGNDSREVAELFENALLGRFQGVFAEVVFAITDWSDDRRFIGPFVETFGSSPM